MTNLWLLKAAVAVLLVPFWSDRVRAGVKDVLTRLGYGRGVGLFALTRFVPCLLAIEVVGLKVPGDSVEWIKLIATHQMGPYSIGFHSLLGAIAWAIPAATPSAMALVLIMIAVEVAAFAVFWRTVADRPRDPIAFDLLAFWLVNPISLFHIALGGQDEALILLAWCGVLWAAMHERARLGGIFGATCVVFSKVLGGVACLPLLVQSKRKAAAGLAVFAGLLVVFIGELSVLHLSLFGFLDEMHFLTSGNVWTMVNLLWPGRSDAMITAQFVFGALASLAAAAYVCARPLRSPLRQALRLTGTVGCAFLLFSPKSPTAWLVMFLPGVLFLILSVEPRARKLLLYGLLPIAAFEPSLWFYFGQGELLQRWSWGFLFIVAVDAVLLAGYARLAWQGLRLDRAAAEDQAAFTPAMGQRAA